MNKVWRKVALASIAFSAIYSIAGYIFYQRQSSLPPLDEGHSLSNYHFPQPNAFGQNDIMDNPLGNPFFEFSPTVATQSQPIIVVSDLVLLGTVSGANPKAVVAEKNNLGVTHILGLGESWLGEKIVSIRKGSIVIWKNNQKVIVQTTP